jgi:hypothetical protein
MSALGLEPRTYGLKERSGRAKKPGKMGRSEDPGASFPPAFPDAVAGDTQLRAEIAEALPALSTETLRVLLAMVRAAKQ